MKWLQKFIIQSLFGYTSDQHAIFMSTPQTARSLMFRGIAIIIGCAAFGYGVFVFTSDWLLKSPLWSAAFAIVCALMLFALELINTYHVLRNQGMTWHAVLTRAIVLTTMLICGFFVGAKALQSDLEREVLELKNSITMTVKNEPRYKEKFEQLNDEIRKRAPQITIEQLKHQLHEQEALEKTSMLKAQGELDGITLDKEGTRPGAGPRYNTLKLAEQTASQVSIQLKNQIAAAEKNDFEIKRLQADLSKLEMEVEKEAETMVGGTSTRLLVIIKLVKKNPLALAILLFYMLLAALPEILSLLAMATPTSPLYNLVTHLDEQEAFISHQHILADTARRRDAFYNKFDELKEGKKGEHD